MANRRQEERERLRQARESRESKQERTGKLRVYAVYGGAALIGVIVLVGVIVAIASSGGGEGGQSHILQTSGSTNGYPPDEREGVEVAAVQTANLNQAAKQAGCQVRLELEDEGHEHISQEAETPDYGTSPPNSGNHATSPYQQADGAYSEMPDEKFLVHSLEHGRMQIQYSPDLPEEAQLELKGLYDTMFGGTLFFPNPNMDYEVAAATWTNLITCPEYKGQATLDAIRAFGKKTWGRYGGEPVNAFGLQGPTPAEPRS